MLGQIIFPSKKYSIYKPNLDYKASKILKSPKDTSKYVSYSKSLEGIYCNISNIKCPKGTYSINLASSNQSINIYSGTIYTVTINGINYKTKMTNSCLSIINNTFSLHILCKSETSITITSSMELTIDSIKYHFVIQPTENTKVIEYTTAKKRIGEKLQTLPLPNLSSNFKVLVNKKDLLVISLKTNTHKYYLTTDGINWTEYSFPYSLVTFSTYEYKNKYIIMSNVTGTSSASAIEYTIVTTDWKTWKTIPNFTTEKINWGFNKYVVNNRLYFIGYASSLGQYLIYTSSDGENFTTINIPDAEIDHPVVSYVGNLFIIENDAYYASGYLYTSSNGTSFTKRSLPCSTEFYNTLYFNGYYAKTPYNNSDIQDKIMYSTDGTTWKTANIPTTSGCRYQESAVFKNKLLVHNYSSSTVGKLYAFTTPTSYTTITLPTNSYGYRRITPINNSYCLLARDSYGVVGAIGASHYVYSTDGINWTEYSFPEVKEYSGDFTYIPELNEVYYKAEEDVTGYSACFYTSTDGKTWTKRTKAHPKNFKRLLNGMLINGMEVVEDSGTITITYSLDNFKTLEDFTISLSDYTSSSSAGSYPTTPTAEIAELNNELFLFLDVGNQYIGKSKHYFKLLELSTKTLYMEVN